MQTTFGEQFGERLHKAIRIEKLSPTQAAKFLDISIVSYRKWCQGDIPHAIYVLAKLGSKGHDLNKLILGREQK